MSNVCLVTGASGKLGTALCRSLLESGYDCVSVHRSRVPDFASNALTPLGVDIEEVQRFSGRSAYCVQADLTVESDRRRVIEVALARFERIDTLVNCAADSNFHRRLLELSFGHEEILQQMFLNSVVPLDMASRVFQSHWKHDRSGNSQHNRCVINISSVSALHVYPSRGQAFYGASKLALNHLTKYLANELEPYGVRANALCPAQFGDSESTGRVVAEVCKLIDGTMTGQVIRASGRASIS